jgi:hypothetical protein
MLFKVFEFMLLKNLFVPSFISLMLRMLRPAVKRNDGIELLFRIVPVGSK